LEKKIVVIVQARMGSTRLPGKVLKEVDGKPLLGYLFDRLKQMQHPATLVLATTQAEEDKKLLKFAKSIGVGSYAGDENDVLDRYYQACKKYKADVVVRVTGDCTLIEPRIVDQILDVFLNNDYDYVSNVNPPTYPDGIDTEIFSFQALERAWNEAELKSEREHVTPFIRNRTDIFTQMNVNYDQDWSDYRLTVDEEEDFNLISQIILHFKDQWETVTMEEIIAYLNEHEELMQLNSKYKRNEGYAKSLQEDGPVE